VANMHTMQSGNAKIFKLNKLLIIAKFCKKSATDTKQNSA